MNMRVRRGTGAALPSAMAVGGIAVLGTTAMLALGALPGPELAGIVLLGIGMVIGLLGGRRVGATSRAARGHEAPGAARQLFAMAFDRSPMPQMIVRSADLLVVEANEACASWLGLAPAVLRTMTIADLISSDEIEMLQARLAHSGAVRRERIHVGQRSVLLSCERVQLEGQLHSLALFDDITELERAGAARRESERRFAVAFDACPLPYAMMRMRDRTMVAVNEAFVTYFGYPREQIVGHTSDELGFYAFPEERRSVRELLDRDRSLHGVEHSVRRASGEIRQISASVETVTIDGEDYGVSVFADVTERLHGEVALRESEARFRELAENIREVFWLYDATVNKVVYVSPAYETVWQRSPESLADDPFDWTRSIHPDDREQVRATSRREDYDQTYRLLRPDGTVRWIHDRAFPVRNGAGAIIRIAGLAEDITDRRGLEDQLRQTQKMESLGMLAGGVAHDFNNLLAVIGSSNGMLAESLPTEGEPRELVDEIDAAVQRATSLTRQLLAFSRKQVVEPKVIDINGAVQDTRKMLRRMVGEDVLLQTSLEGDLRAVRVDPGYLVQVLMNLAVNARDAMPRGGTLEIATRNITFDEAFMRRHPAAKAGPAVLLTVTDTGCGMAPDVLARVFEPFFTTKEQGKGTGMGLAVVHGIVDQAGGFLEVDSEVGKGSTFCVYFPVADAPAERSEQVTGALALGAERILLVDDDEYVRRAAARALRARGYTVLEAADARGALAQLHQRVDLLLTDVVMPRMDGRELAEAARVKYPDLKVLYTSGYTDDAIVRHGVMQGSVELLEKPFRVNALATRVRQVLDR